MPKKNYLDKSKMKHTALSSSSKKFKMLCCLTSALFLRDDTNFCGVHPAHLFHTVQMLTNTQSWEEKKNDCPNSEGKNIPSFDPTVL